MSVNYRCCHLVILNACDLGPECHDLRFKVFALDLTYKLYAPAIVRNRRSRSDRNRGSREWKGFSLRNHMCSLSVNALLRCLVKQVP